MSQTELTDLIYKSRKHILEILESQGYDINDYNEFNIHEIHTMIQSRQLDLLVKNTTTNKKSYIKYHLVKTLRLNNIQEIIEDLFVLEKILSKNDDLIIIIKDEPNESLNRNIINIWENENIYIRIINIKRLQFNLLKHDLQPKYEIMRNPDEIEKFIKDYNIDINKINKQIPDISRFSPVSLMIGIRPGEICKIERDSKTSINSLFYRICI